MIRTIVSHDTTTGKARVRFEHNGVTVEDNFDLIAVVPGTKFIFAAMEIDFTEQHQETALQRLEESIQRQIEEGVIVSPPAPQQPQEEPEE